MAKEDAVIVQEFTKVVVSHLKDVLIALPALIPQTKEDELLFKEGANKISKIIYELEHAETVREIGKNIDIAKVINDFDMESVKTLNSRINSSAHNSIAKLDEMINNMRGD